jgi:Fic family protein
MLFVTPELSDQEKEVVGEIEETRRGLNHMLREPPRWYGPLRRTAFARNIQASNSIEGYNVSLEDAVAAVAGEQPSEATDEDWNAVRNYWDAMTYIIQLANDTHFRHTEALIRSLHYMMMKHDFAAAPGLFRPGSVFVWSAATQEVVYEGPDFELVPSLLQELVDGLNADHSDTPPLVRAGMAHLNLVMIHPFRDGNGRMARALQTLVLARDLILAPEFSSIEEYLGRNTAAYYEVLGEVGGGSWHPERETRPWVRFVLLAHHRQALTFARRIRETERLWEAIDHLAQERGIDERNLGTLYNAAVGFKIRRSEHIAYAEVSERVGTADLKRLVDMDLLVPVGERRGRYYLTGDELRGLREKTREPKEPLTNPFAA